MYKDSSWDLRVRCHSVARFEYLLTSLHDTASVLLDCLEIE
jgi:hypothetical protein